MKSNACRVLGTLGRPLQRTGDFWARPPPVRQLRAGERQNAQSLVDWTAKTDIDHDQAVKDTRAGAIQLPILYPSLFITESESGTLLQADMPVPGLKLFSHR